MMRRAATALGGWGLVLLGVIVFLGIATILGLGYRATRGWQQSSELLKERDTSEAIDLLVKALTRDMAGMQSRVLASGDWAESLQSLADTSTQISIAFTRYPYPESFFTWRNDDPAIVFFNRTDRQPLWMPVSHESHRFPVPVVFDPAAAASLRQRIDLHGAGRYRYVVFDTSFGGHPYQVVARLLYTNPMQERPDAVIGFTVNLDWIRNVYFSDLLPRSSARPTANVASTSASSTKRERSYGDRTARRRRSNGSSPFSSSIPRLKRSQPFPRRRCGGGRYM